MNKDYLPYFLVSSPAFLWRFESVETDTSSRPIYRIHPGRGVAGGGGDAVYESGGDGRRKF